MNGELIKPIVFLKISTGMWTVQEIARCLDYQYSYAEMAEQASQGSPGLNSMSI